MIWTNKWKSVLKICLIRTKPPLYLDVIVISASVSAVEADWSNTPWCRSLCIIEKATTAEFPHIIKWANQYIRSASELKASLLSLQPQMSCQFCSAFLKRYRMCNCFSSNRTLLGKLRSPFMSQCQRIESAKCNNIVPVSCTDITSTLLTGLFFAQDLVMDILRVLSTPDLEVRKKTLQLALDLVSSRNVEEVSRRWYPAAWKRGAGL